MKAKKSKLIYECDRCSTSFILFHGYLSRFVSSKLPELLVEAEDHGCTK